MFREALFILIATFALSYPLSVSGNTQTTSDNPAPQSNQTPAAWEITLEAHHNDLIRKNGPGTDAALRQRLLKMAAEDQAARGIEDGKQVSVLTKETMIQKLPPIDARLTAELQQIVKESGWPTIALVGIDASNAAMLILTHTADHAWQRQLLPQLQTLAENDKIDGSSLALVIDKELVAEGKLQRYGSQFKMIDGTMAMYAVEDPSNLNQRRATVLLPPMEAYKQMLSDIYHLKTTDGIVSPSSPTQK